ncbi:MAG: M28 family peptidase [Verrucomicrobiota bacterium]
MKKFVIKTFCRILILSAAITAALWFFLAQPILSSNPVSETKVDVDRLETHVKKLSINFHPRNFRQIANLEATADYIYKHFDAAGGQVETQAFEASGGLYKNVSCLFGSGDRARLIVGAHYDSHEETPGADDNASGVAGLIELAYLLGNSDLDIDVELVAYTLEEPPFFGSKSMGSYIHAKATRDQGREIIGMIALEMIGYFSDEKGSQNYPVPFFKILYPNKGNFIAIIGRTDHRSFTKQVKRGMKGASKLPVFSINAPAFITGIDFSDHRNYWHFGYDAVMVTDTAFYRNKAYHTENDTWDRLDYEKMSQVVSSLHHSILGFAKESATKPKKDVPKVN